MNTKKFLHKSSIVLVVIIFLLNTKATAQEKILLSDENMPDFSLRRLDSTFWAISDTSFVWAAEQTWTLKDNGDYYVKYCEFNNEVDAINAVAYEANSFSLAYFIGFTNGGIYGDNSWVSADGGAVYFQKWNYGIKIFKPTSFNLEDRQTIINIADLISDKIDGNILPTIRLKENELLEYRISDNDYQNLVNNSEGILRANGYAENEKMNSKWIIPEDSLVLGIRKQWSKNNSYVCIDIASYSDTSYAYSAVNNFSELSFTPIPICNFDTEESIDSFVIYLTNSWGGGMQEFNPVSIVGLIRNCSVHLYYYNDSGFDPIFFKSLLKSLIFDTNNVRVAKLDGSFIKIHSNPTNNIITIENENGGIDLYNLKLYNALGKEVYSKKIKFSSSFKLNLLEFIDGIYFLKLQNDKVKLSQKILVKNK